MGTISLGVGRAFLVILGSILLALGAIGLLVPVIPGFVFLVAGVYLIARAWKKHAARVEQGGPQ
jgi:uncharacterized membrane protein YbaN (DUF454 family)